MVASDGFAMADLLYLASTLLVSLVMACLPLGLVLRAFRFRLAVLGCVLLVLGVVFDVAAQIAGVRISGLSLLSSIVQGSGIGVFFVAWGCLYVHAETELVEYAFMGWFPLLVALLAAAAGINMLGEAFTILYSGLLVALPCASLACFRSSERLVDEHDGRGVLLDDLPCGERRDVSLRQGVIYPLVNLVVVFAAISLAWNAFFYGTHFGFRTQLMLFAVGIAALFVIIWLALRMTRHFSLSTLYRWALPLMAMGVALHRISGATFVIPAFLCLSIVNTGFEVMGKLYCIYVAKRMPVYSAGIISAGFAAASLGGIVGTGLWGCALEALGPRIVSDALLVALVVFVVAASMALGNDYESQGSMRRPISEVSALFSKFEAPIVSDSGGDAMPGWESGSFAPAAGDDAAGTLLASRCVVVAGQFGLSARELDVLALLAQGRSRAHIREALYISKGTVDSHIHHIYSKMGVSSKDELMRMLLD